MDEFLSKLKSNNYTISNRQCKIVSNSNLSDFIKDDKDDDKFYNISDLITDFDVSLILRHFKIKDFFITKKLFNFFVTNDNDFISYFFSFNYLDDAYQWSRYNKMSNHENHIINTYRKLSDDLNYLHESYDGYISYGKISSNCKIRLNKLISNLNHQSNNNIYINYEKLSNEYKSRFNINNYKLALLNGDDILCGYKDSFYESNYGNMLSNSCMNNKMDYLSLYTKNKKNIYLLVLLNNDKIIARSLIWILDDNSVMMDRVYHNNDHLSFIYYNISKQNGWNEFNNLKYNNESKDYKKNLKVRLNIKNIKEFPYLDTFKYRSRITGYFHNYPPYMLYTTYQSTYGKSYNKFFRDFS